MQNFFLLVEIVQMVKLPKIVQNDKMNMQLNKFNWTNFQSSIIGWPGETIKLAKTVKLQKLHNLDCAECVVELTDNGNN